MAGSTCEAEYIAALEAANEGVWMKEFISDLGVIPNASGPMKIFCDNTGAIALAKESRFHKRTKHTTLQFHPRSSQGRRHRSLKNTHGSECCRPVD